MGIRGKEMGNGKENKQEEKIRQLEEKLKRLEEEKGEVAEGTAAGILKGVGGIIPGLDGLLKGLEKSEAFRERLKAIDKEVEIRLSSQPLKRTEEGVSSFPSDRSRRTVPKNIPCSKRQTTAQARREVIASREPPVDVFDEGTHFRVLTELPGVEEKDIKVILNEAKLIISSDTPSHKYYKEIILPYAPKGRMDRSYRNGVLELTLEKE
jgi:HSP20 family molecular chaperone IbpA